MALRPVAYRTEGLGDFVPQTRPKHNNDIESTSHSKESQINVHALAKVGFTFLETH